MAAKVRSVEPVPTAVVEFLRADERIERCPPDVDYAISVIDRVLVEEAEDALHAAAQGRWGRPTPTATTVLGGVSKRGCSPPAGASGRRLVRTRQLWRSSPSGSATPTAPGPAARGRSRPLERHGTTTSTRPQVHLNGRCVSCVPLRSTTPASSTRSGAGSRSRRSTTSSQLMMCSTLVLNDDLSLTPHLVGVAERVSARVTADADGPRTATREWTRCSSDPARTRHPQLPIRLGGVTSIADTELSADRWLRRRMVRAVNLPSGPCRYRRDVAWGALRLGVRTSSWPVWGRSE
jgi:hypothetical protein